MRRMIQVFVLTVTLIWLVFFLTGCNVGNAPVGASGNTEKTPGSNAIELARQAHTSPSYVGSKQCINCHSQQYDLWRESHHDLAMQAAGEQTILGDFNNVPFKYFDTVSTFYRKDNKFLVRTNGPDGKLADYPIAYTFGVYPLQQYLIAFPNGRYQVLDIAWDARKAAAGGQRWFHLHPKEHIKHDDELHWTGINNNWNFMCADCHSTNLQKNYDATTKSYSTAWSELNVSCEACHGPASQHLVWTKDRTPGIANKGFSVLFDERDNVSWTIDPATGNAIRSQSKSTETEVSVCAQCHSRRSTEYVGNQPQDALLDNFRVALLTEPLYHVDGQINDEVYVYGSFVQSKMYHAGVTCSDCHEPHSLKLRSENNALCSRCHLTEKYDSKNHHLHEAETRGAQCVNCHMPSKNYMVIDARRDHSFRIPRPDLSASMGVPNACNQCHEEKSAGWAADILKNKFGEPARKHYAQALFAGRNGLPNAEQLLTQLLLDKTQPAIARATAATLLPRYLSKHSAPILQQAAYDENELVGLGMATVLESIPVRYRPMFAIPLLYDDRRVTRSLAASALAGISLADMAAESREKLSIALKEYEVAQQFNTDRPESLTSLADLYVKIGQTKKAEQFYRDAIGMAPYYVPAYINLADGYRSSGREQDGKKVLAEALENVNDKAAIHHAMGLLLVRQNEKNKAIDYLRQAAESTNSTDRYKYVYAIALNSVGKSEQAVKVLEQALTEFPANTDILYSLVAINRDSGNQSKAEYYRGMLNDAR